MLGMSEDSALERLPLRGLLMGSLTGEKTLALLEAQLCATGQPQGSKPEAESPAANRRLDSDVPVPL